MADLDYRNALEAWNHPQVVIDAEEPLVDKFSGLFGDAPGVGNLSRKAKKTAEAAISSPTWDKTRALLMRESCTLFAGEVLSGPPQPPYNGKFMVSAHHLVWGRLVSQFKRLCILAPRDHSKTVFFSLAYPLWKASFCPRETGYIFSATQTQAQRILDDIRIETETNPQLQWLVPAKKEKWSANALRFSNGHTIYARGFLSKVRGAHPCLHGDTLITTDRGVVPISSLEGKTATILTGLGTWKTAKFWKSGHKSVISAEFGNKFTRDKAQIKLTPDHRVLSDSGWKSIEDCVEGEAMSLPPSTHALEFECAGWFWNDGRWTNGQQRIIFSAKDGEALERYKPLMTKNPYVGDGCSYRLAKAAISRTFCLGEGNRLKCSEKGPPRLTTAEQKTAWVRGMMSANGTVARSVRLKLASRAVVECVESVLHEFGVKTTPIVRHVAYSGRNSSKPFVSYTLHVHKKSIRQYLAVFGFVQTYKKEAAEALAFQYYGPKRINRGRPPRRVWTQEADVYDFQVQNPSCEQEMSAVVDGVIVHNCWLVVDDGLNDETAYSEMQRKRQIDYFYTAITNMIVPGGQIIVVGTPFAKSDLYGDLKENPEYKFARFPAIDKKGAVLFPARYSRELLDTRKTEIGSVRFAREFLCSPVADDMSLFPETLFKGDPVEQFALVLGAERDYWNAINPDLTVYMGVDLAISSNIGADYTVIFTMGVDGHGNRWIMDIQRLHGKPFQEQLSVINSTAQKYSPGLIYIEANQMQRVFGDELIRTTALPIQPFTTTAQKHKLDKGLPSLRLLLENRKVRIPRGDKNSVDMTNILIEELNSFTFREGKLESVGQHDDVAMSFYICDQAVRQGAFSFSFGEEEGSDGPELTPPGYSDPKEDVSLVDSSLMGAPLSGDFFGGY